MGCYNPETGSIMSSGIRNVARGIILIFVTAIVAVVIICNYNG